MSLLDELEEETKKDTKETLVKSEFLDNKKEKRTLRLKPGKTVIGNICGKSGDAVKKYQVYYGNIIIDENRKINLLKNEERYQKLLDDFLNSKEGELYIVPTQAEIKAATEEIIAEIKKIKDKKKQEPVKEKIDDENIKVKKVKKEIELVTGDPLKAAQELEQPVNELKEKPVEVQLNKQEESVNNIPVKNELKENAVKNEPKENKIPEVKKPEPVEEKEKNKEEPEKQVVEQKPLKEEQKAPTKKEEKKKKLKVEDIENVIKNVESGREKKKYIPAPPHQYRKPYKLQEKQDRKKKIKTVLSIIFSLLLTILLIIIIVDLWKMIKIEIARIPMLNSSNSLLRAFIEGAIK